MYRESTLQEQAYCFGPGLLTTHCKPTPTLPTRPLALPTRPSTQSLVWNRTVGCGRAGGSCSAQLGQSGGRREGRAVFRASNSGGVLAHRAAFFDHSPPVPVFASPHQTICPQEARGDVANSDLVPFYWEPAEGRGDVAIPPTRVLQGRFAVQCSLLGGLLEARINLGLEIGYLIQR